MTAVLARAIFRLKAPEVEVPATWDRVHFIVKRVGDDWIWPARAWNPAIHDWDNDVTNNRVSESVKQEEDEESKQDVE